MSDSKRPGPHRTRTRPPAHRGPNPSPPRTPPLLGEVWGGVTLKALVLLGQVRRFAGPYMGGRPRLPLPLGGGSRLFGWWHGLMAARHMHNKFLFGGWLSRVSEAFVFACRRVSLSTIRVRVTYSITISKFVSLGEFIDANLINTL